MDFAKLRIAFLAGILGQGGAERQLYFIIRTLRELGCNPDVYTFSQGDFWETPIRELGVRVINITESKPLHRLQRLISYIKQGDYDVIHSQHFYTNLYAVVVAWLCQIKCVGSLRNNTLSEVSGMGFLGWLSLILPPKLGANSYTGIRNAKKYLRNPKHIIFLPNFVDTEFFSPGQTIRNDEKFTVITVGTVWKPKRIDRVLEIAEKIHQNPLSKNIIFEIIGDGDELENMLALARSKNLLNTKVFFKGRLSDVRTVYQTANSLLLTSDHEGTPNVVLEAMASGLPVVATNVGDVPELLINGVTGFSIEPTNIYEMAEIIKRLSRDRSLCKSIGEKARELVINNYSQKKLIEGLTRLYFPPGSKTPRQ